MDLFLQQASSKTPPELFQYLHIFNHKTKLVFLKAIAKKNKLKISGTKKELIQRLEIFFKLSFYAKKIQVLVKRHFAKRKNAAFRILKCFKRYQMLQLRHLRGGALLRRQLCNNESDFLTGDCCKDISADQFFSFQDIDGFYYGFDLQSFYNLVLTKKLKNPYNRNELNDKVINNMHLLIKYCRFSKIPLTLEMQEKPRPKKLDDRIREIFFIMDSLGNYTNPNWLFQLSNHQLLKFLRELSDIWNYRSQISVQVKREICPPYGDPFRGHGQFYYFDASVTINHLRLITVTVLESMLLKSINQDSKTLGAYFILSALTLVSNDAAIALPWLYQAVN